MCYDKSKEIGFDLGTLAYRGTVEASQSDWKDFLESRLPSEYGSQSLRIRDLIDHTISDTTIRFETRVVSFSNDILAQRLLAYAHSGRWIIDLIYHHIRKNEIHEKKRGWRQKKIYLRNPIIRESAIATISRTNTSQLFGWLRIRGRIEAISLEENPKSDWIENYDIIGG